jgi:alkanesulfonate monooxygenase SsuD/methylene tetrahydromethanopterin reductase-like flavin-dependent oxidoreductase (luciferase family)
LPAALRHPLHIAEEAAVVDLISDGRLDLGLGAGYRAAEFAAFGADFAARFRTLDDTVPRLREMWTAGAVLPQPVQRPIPLWLGYSGPRGARRAGRLGTGLLAVDPALVEPYLAGLREGGHDVATARTAGLVPAVVSEDPERDWPEIARHHARQWDSYFRHAAPDGAPAPRIDAERARARGFSPRNGALLYGTPEDVAATLTERLAGTPVDTLLVWASVGAMLPERAATNVRLLLTRLAPLVATQPGVSAGRQHA